VECSFSPSHSTTTPKRSLFPFAFCFLSGIPMIAGSSSKAGKVAWSPFSGQRSRYVACGTPAGSFSDAFSEGSTSLNLEIMELGTDGLQTVGSIDTPDRFWRLAWSSFSGSEDRFPLGVIAGACVDGEVQLWDPSKIING
jgi:hypothetical protein